MTRHQVQLVFVSIVLVLFWATSDVPAQRIHVNGGGTSVLGTMLAVGGTSSAFPALKRNAAGIDFRLADDSAYADITMRRVLVAGNGSIVLGSNAFAVATTPTISSGFGTTPSVTASNGSIAMRVNVGTGGTAINGVLGLPTAGTGWNCFCTDITTATATVDVCKQTASTATTATIGNYTSGGVTGAWVASDILAVSCFGY